MQAVLDPVVRNIILDENNEIQPFSEDKLYAGAMGALTAGLMNLPASIGQYSSLEELESKLSKTEKWT